MILRQQKSTLFPYTTLFRSARARTRAGRCRKTRGGEFGFSFRDRSEQSHWVGGWENLSRSRRWQGRAYDEIDRKSTRLNSSHRTNSYAVFCLKKKNTSNNSP